MWRELKYFTKYVGVTPKFALYTATLGNAEIAGLDAITGSIEVGKSADILVADKILSTISKYGGSLYGSGEREGL